MMAEPTTGRGKDMIAAQMPMRNRAARLLTVMLLVITSLAFGSDTAFAATTYECTGANTGSQSWHTGSTVRYTGGSSNSNIVWSFFTSTGCPNSVLPGGGSASLSMRVQFCSGSGGTSIGDTFTSVTAKAIATSVLPGTCFRVQWLPNNAATDNENFHGKIIWQVS